MTKIPNYQNGDETYSSCVAAGDFIYLAHHAGGFDKNGIRHQMRAAFEGMKATLAKAGATMDDMAQIHLYLKGLNDFDGAVEVFSEYFKPGRFPARMTTTSRFLDNACLCMADGVAYKERSAYA